MCSLSLSLSLLRYDVQWNLGVKSDTVELFRLGLWLKGRRVEEVRGGCCGG